MNRKLTVCALVLLAVCPFLLAEKDLSRMQYGFRFGIAKNGYTLVPDGGGNPFADVNIESRTGFIAGAFYDIFLRQGTVNLYFTTSANYKVTFFKGNYVTAGETPVLGKFKNIFHIVDVPLGIKMSIAKLNGRPFFGGGLQLDFIVGDGTTFSGGDGTEYDTIPAYNTRVNAGPYFNAGFEIPIKTFIYCFEFKYIAWTRDNFVPSTSFYKRDKGELQLTFGIKVR